jgi:hypothetical protein
MLVHVGSMADNWPLPIIPSSAQTCLSPQAGTVPTHYASLHRCKQKTDTLLTLHPALCSPPQPADTATPAAPHPYRPTVYSQLSLACCNVFVAGETLRGRFPSDRFGNWSDVTTHTLASSGQDVQSHPPSGCTPVHHIPFALVKMLNLQRHFSCWWPCSNTACDSALARVSRQHLL